MVKAAKDAGADAVKFQTHYWEDEQLDLDVYSPHFKGQSRYQWVKRNTVSTPLDRFWTPLKAYCREIGITFFSTPMSRGAAMLLQSLGVPFWKVASSDVLDFVLLDFLTNSRKTLIVPMGMSTLSELDQSVDFLKRRNASIILLHAISQYPYPAIASNLLTIKFLQKRYAGIPIGFSQNSPWIEPPLAAVALGAVMIEQHFTSNRDLWGPDHKISMIPNEFAIMVSGIRELQSDPHKQQEYLSQPVIQPFLGSETKVLQDGEASFRPLFRKSLMAGQDIPAGTEIRPEMLYAMRPQAYAGGLSSEHYE